jgi:hypothetical protein
MIKFIYDVNGELFFCHVHEKKTILPVTVC